MEKAGLWLSSRDFAEIAAILEVLVKKCGRIVWKTVGE
jgi:hypothetical protein